MLVLLVVFRAVPNCLSVRAANRPVDEYLDYKPHRSQLFNLRRSIWSMSGRVTDTILEEQRVVSYSSLSCQTSERAPHFSFLPDESFASDL